MNDQQAYALNALWSRYYQRGRIVRFRSVAWGQQAEGIEILTAEQHQYLLAIYSARLDPENLTRAAELQLALWREKFPVAEPLASSQGSWIAPGPQGAWMILSRTAAGHSLPAQEWSSQDLAHLGLRLAWMHRLLPPCPPPDDLAPRLSRALERPSRQFPSSLRPMALKLLELLETPILPGWCHGDLHPSNVIVDGERQIQTLCDWGLLHVGDPLEDLLDALVGWCCDDRGDLDASRSGLLLEAYRSLVPGAVPEAWGSPLELWQRAIRCWLARRLVETLEEKRPWQKRLGLLLIDSETLARDLANCR